MSYKPFKMKGMPMLRNFGIGQGVSPYKQGIWGIIGSELAKKGAEGKGDEPEGNVKKEQLADPKSDDKPQKKDDKTSKELLKPGEGEKSDTTGTAILKGLTAGITHGLNAVYGTGTVTPKIKMSDRLKKDKEKSEDSTKSGAERVEDVLGGSKKYEIKSGNTLSQIAKDNNTTVEELMKKNPDIKDKNKIRSGQSINL